MSSKNSLSKSHNFSIAFEQMCSIVAIGKTKDVNETIKELILHCFVLLPKDQFSTPIDFANSIEGLFGLSIRQHEIDFCLQQLIESEIIQVSNSRNFIIRKEEKDFIKKRIDESYDLEIQVRDSWKGEIADFLETIDFGTLWGCLKQYLARAFQRHGIQTIALIDPAVEINHTYSSSLSGLLEEVVSNVISSENGSLVKKLISDFMATTGNHPDRATFISQLADGAFTYFSLTIDPEISKEFRKHLNPLILYLDTNFIYGILDLTINPLVAVSNELITAINKFSLPFELRSHKRTIEELSASIDYQETRLGGLNWSRNISRAASSSRNISGVEQRFHQKFLETGIDVHSFFAPFHHADEIIKSKNIIICSSSSERLQERSTLISEYTAYLESKGKYKPYQLIEHDMTLLDEVRQLRNESKSSLDAGALLITCDFSLYRFDWEYCKKSSSKPCTVLPNVFWQVLRPFVPTDNDFDRSFAETFAIPEFRIIGSHASEACSKMLSILAGYVGFPEETAARMLSNDILIENLQRVENDQQFQELIDLGIVKENTLLIEENRFIEAQYENVKQKNHQTDLELANARELAKQLKHQIEIATNNDEQNSKLIEIEQDKRTQAENDKRKYQFLLLLSLSILIAALLVFLAEVLFWPKFLWLQTHDNQLGLRICFDILLVIVPFILIIPQWRKISITFLGFTLFPTIIQIIDKPK